MRALCLDGPLNGQYAEVEYAEVLGYSAEQWSPSHRETVLMHSGTARDAFTTDGVPVEFNDEEEYGHE